MTNRNLSDFESLRDDDPIKNYLKERFPQKDFMKSIVQASRGRFQEFPDYAGRNRVLNTAAAMLMDLRKEFSDDLQLMKILYYANRSQFNGKLDKDLEKLGIANLQCKVSENNSPEVLVWLYTVNSKSDVTDTFDDLSVPEKKERKISIENAVAIYNKYINDYNNKFNGHINLLALPLEEQNIDRNQFLETSLTVRKTLLIPPKEFNISFYSNYLAWVDNFDEVSKVIEDAFTKK